MIITEPGLYEHFPAAAYHLDPLPEPSLSGSIAIPLVNRSPRHAWHRHPRFGQYGIEKSSRKMDLGTVCHSLLFGVGRDVVVIEEDSYRKAVAQSARDEATAAGKTPALRADYDIAEVMADVARKHLRYSLGGILTDGHKETVVAWREGSAWCRGMIDLISPDLCTIVDYKTTGTSARPEDYGRTLYDSDYHMKSAFYERGLDVLSPGGTGRRKFILLVQETDEPFECALIQIPESGMTIGRKQAAYAIDLWAECMATNTWPGYGPGIFSADMPPWIETRWIAREMSDPRATGALAPGGGHRPVIETRKQLEGFTI